MGEKDRCFLTPHTSLPVDLEVVQAFCVVLFLRLEFISGYSNNPRLSIIGLFGARGAAVRSLMFWFGGPKDRDILHKLDPPKIHFTATI
ncbi:hypothetical protein Lal_00034616 [Lupinus albus]|nr:hypothetical protein Lal_00034616 [Lupinus albus]